MARSNREAKEEKARSAPKKAKKKAKKKKPPTKRQLQHLSTKPKVHIDADFVQDKAMGAQRFYHHYNKGPWRLFRASGYLRTIEFLVANIRKVWDKTGHCWDVRTNIKDLAAHLNLRDSKPIFKVLILMII
jgi:hypothetical protein